MTLFLAGLDYVTRVHEIEIRRLSSIHPSVRVTIVSVSNARMDFFQILVVASLGHTLGHFIYFFFWKKNPDIFTKFFHFNMETIWSKKKIKTLFL